MPHEAFNGGEKTVAKRLQELGFQVEEAGSKAEPSLRAKAVVSSVEPQFWPGQTYQRKQIHELWGGQRQSGIVTPAGRPYILLFTSGGEGNVYADGWDGEVYRYFGEGQAGSMTFTRGNRALRDHALNGKSLHLFEAVSKAAKVRYVGEFACSSFEWVWAPDSKGAQREAIVFHLVRLAVDAVGGPPEVEDLELPSDLEKLRELALKAVASPKGAREGRRTYYARSEAVRRYVLARAAGTCECCGSPAPFRLEDGSPYLEPHHTRRLSDGGPDDPQWVAAICPNCHRRIHYGERGTALNAELIRRLRLKE